MFVDPKLDGVRPVARSTAESVRTEQLSTAGADVNGLDTEVADLTRRFNHWSATGGEGPLAARQGDRLRSDVARLLETAGDGPFGDTLRKIEAGLDGSVSVAAKTEVRPPDLASDLTRYRLQHSMEAPSEQVAKRSRRGTEGQRQKALRMTRLSPKHSVGAAIEPLLSQATFWAGNIAAGKVGDFYEQQASLLHSPATDANIEEFARRETDFFELSGGFSGFVGGFLDAEDRARMIKRSAAQQAADD